LLFEKACFRLVSGLSRKLTNSARAKITSHPFEAPELSSFNDLLLHQLSSTMLQDSSSSPFDDAAARPFLNEPAKKTRWSWFSSSGTYKTAKFSLPSADDESNDHCDELDITYRGGGYDAPDLAHQELLQAEIADEEAMGDEGAFVLARLEGGTALDLAILEERHEGIANINFEMQKINEIQKGKHCLVGGYHTIDSIRALVVIVLLWSCLRFVVAFVVVASYKL